MKAEMRALRRAWQAEEHTKHLEAAKEAMALWNAAQEKGESSYLARKKVEAYGIRYGVDGQPFLAVPLRDVASTLWSVQKIYDDGNKRFLPGGRKKGCFHLIGTLAMNDTVLRFSEEHKAPLGSEALQAFLCALHRNVSFGLGTLNSDFNQ